jgi:hypothetical protein
MATVAAFGGGTAPNAANLSNAQTGNADSTNVVDTGAGTGPVLLKITSTIGATPTVTVNIQGSPDGTVWYNIPYSDSATPTTVAVAALTITTATTSYKHLQPNYGWRYLKLVYSSNTNVTLTVDAWAF